MRQRFASGTCLFKSLITQMIFEDVSLAKESNHMEGTKNKLKGPFLLSALSLQGTLPSTGECVASSIFKTICVLFFFFKHFHVEIFKNLSSSGIEAASVAGATVPHENSSDGSLGQVSSLPLPDR